MGIPWREDSNDTVGWSEPAIFNNFGRHIFRTFRVQANVCSLMKCLICFPVILKRLTLNDPEMPFTTRPKICFHLRFDSSWENKDTQRLKYSPGTLVFGSYKVCRIFATALTRGGVN